VVPRQSRLCLSKKMGRHGRLFLFGDTMNSEQKDMRYIVVDRTHFGLLAQASALIGSYALQGLMLVQDPEKLVSMTETGTLVLALQSINDVQQVVGSIAITVQWPDGKRELGAWAVQHELRRHGVGIGLLEALSVHLANSPNGLQDIIAFANHNSGPIFARLGATPLSHSLMHKDVFIPCQSCHCDKSCLPLGQMCVDTIYNVSPVMRQLAEEYSQKLLLVIQ